tara:strand:- start:35 stop:610 length:576 start_codon:yes stop_codon:yes gene_type:complete
MGNAIVTSHDLNVLLIGPSSAGKTTILYTLRLQEVNKNFKSTTGFNYEIIKCPYKKFRFVLNVWDLSGKEELQDCWPYFYENFNANVILYVVNANDRESQIRARTQFAMVMNEMKLQESMKCVIANVQNAGDDNLQTDEQIRVNLGIDQLESEVMKITMMRLNSFNVEEVAEIKKEICEFFAKKEKMFKKN